MSNTSHSRTRSRRRLVLASFYGAMAMGIGVALAAAPGRGPVTPGRGPATAIANKAAAEVQIEKAKALYDAGKFAEAQAENDKALALDPSNETALLLKRVLAAKIAAGAETTTTTQAGTAPTGRLPLLNAQQISMIRLMELGPDDARVTGRVDPKVLEEFWNNVVKKDPMVDASPTNHDKFINPTNFPIQARRIREANELKYMEGVMVTSDPASITAFRQTAMVHNYVLMNCATADCHGGDKAGNFRLVYPATSMEQHYTNFYILSMYANADGKMIDRVNPEKSLLLQYGLPWASAAVKHPKVELRKMAGTSDPRYAKGLEWIRSLGLTRPNYHLSYEVPGMAAASAPATAPASTSAPAGK